VKFSFLSFGELSTNPYTGHTPTPQERLGAVVDAAVLAEELGHDGFGVGEHHGQDFWALSTPPVVLGAIAARTSRIRLRTGVTVLPNLDPVRVAEDYATVDALSGGRVELTIGKGNFPQPWELFGQDQEEQRERLAEGVDLLRQIWSSDGLVNWSGRFRPPLVDASIGPRPTQTPPPIWWGVSTAPWSVEFAAERGLPIVLGGVVQSKEHYGSLADHYRERYAAHGHDPASMHIGTVSNVYVRHDGERARKEFQPYYEAVTKDMRLALRQGFMLPNDYQERLRGPLVVGNPEEVAHKLLDFHARYGHDLQFVQTDLGGQPFRQVAETMELFTAEVIPIIERELASSPVSDRSAEHAEVVR
jgi:alkanesulfonate monooxygenase SsuD/methylene tetrahydromethanopterin reductase-like flavin-dependent oxidoreductase (luciferase family)